jgi:hypothetical protein
MTAFNVVRMRVKRDVRRRSFRVSARTLSLKLS